MARSRQAGLVKWLPVVAMMVVSCSSTQDDDTPPLYAPGSDLYDKQVVAQPTYYEHVQPILFQHCVRCHQDNSPAAHKPMTTYALAKNLAKDIRHQTIFRLMPPWGADNSGACNTFEHAGWLSDLEIATLAKWVDKGAKEGDPSLNRELPGPLPRVVDPADPNVVKVSMGSAYQPKGLDDYRCFVLDLDLDRDRYLTAADIVPTDPEIIHHIILYSLGDERAQQKALELDQAHEGLGYHCPGTALPAEYNSRPLSVQSPLYGGSTFPEGTGVLIPAHRKIVAQVHMATHHSHAQTPSERLDVYLRFADQVQRPSTGFLMNIFTIFLHEGKNVVELATDRPMLLGPSENASGPVSIAPGRIKLYGLLAHMHGRGRKFRFEYDHEGQTTCLLDVPRFDTRWQQYYFMEQPLVIPAGATYRLRCEYDTAGVSPQNPVTYGAGGLMDEMCLAIVYATPALPGE